MHYFLCDDTVEINNNYMRNSGRWECPVFFTRKELELQPTMTHTPGMYAFFPRLRTIPGQ